MIELEQISTVGNGLARPECALCTSNGRTYVSDWRGGVTIVEPDGSQWSLLARRPDVEVQPNGIALMEDGSILLCHLGADTGGVFRLDETGEIRPFLTDLEGQPLPPTNYAHLDDKGRVWITVSTRKIPRALAYRPDCGDGFIVLVDRNGARIVADHLGYTNECIVHPDGNRTILVEDNDPSHVSRVEAAYQAATMGRPHLDNVKSRKLGNISSLAFGGTDLSTAYLGCLLDSSIYSFKSPYCGHPPPHWGFRGPQRYL